MHQYMYATLMTVAAIILSSGFMFFVGAMRGKTKIDSPAMSGHEDLEKALRIQYNTMEQFVLFVPALWMYAVCVNDLWAGLFGLVWICGRLLYGKMYFSNPKSRSIAFALTFFPTIIMALWAGIVVLL